MTSRILWYQKGMRRMPCIAHDPVMFADCDAVLPAQAGMDMGIVNAQQVEADKYELLDKELLEFVEDVLLNRRVPLACEYIS